MKSGTSQGKLIKWKDDRGFGFIQPVDNNQEVFLHISEVKDSTRRPQIGDTIEYYLVADEDGKVRACNAYILGARNTSIPSSVSLESQSRSNTAAKSSFPILQVLLLSFLPLVGAIHFAWTTANFIPLIIYPFMSLLTFGLYADDKSRAKRGVWRTSERTLHLCELGGEWLGGFIAQRKLHHKTVKGSYQFVFWMIVSLHIVFWTDWLFLGGNLVKPLLGSNFRR
jgi:uncharacterized membrane protein YsdA (DUF1294 family)/cold shock CspA family protein